MNLKMNQKTEFQNMKINITEDFKEKLANQVEFIAKDKKK